MKVSVSAITEDLTPTKCCDPDDSSRLIMISLVYDKLAIIVYMKMSGAMMYKNNRSVIYHFIILKFIQKQ